jgi:heat shock protein HslJ
MKARFMNNREQNNYRSKRGELLIVLLSCLVVCGCGYGKGPTEPMEILTANSWVLCEMKQKPVTKKDFENGTPFIKFQEGGHLQIFTGCNYITGTFAIYGPSLRMKFNADNPCQQQVSSDFLDILKSSNTYKTKLERLVLSRDAREIMYFFPK